MRHALPIRRELVEGPADPELSADGQPRPSIWQRTCRRSISTQSTPVRCGVPYETAEAVAAAPRSRCRLCDGVAEFDRLLRRVHPHRGAEGRQRSALARDDQRRVDSATTRRPTSSASRVVDTHRGADRRAPRAADRRRVPWRRDQRLPVPRARAAASARLLLSQLHLHQPRRRGARRRTLDRHASTRRPTCAAPACRWVCSREHVMTQTSTTSSPSSPPRRRRGTSSPTAADRLIGAGFEAVDLGAAVERRAGSRLRRPRRGAGRLEARTSAARRHHRCGSSAPTPTRRACASSRGPTPAASVGSSSASRSTAAR